ncbi:peptidylprolyl isomerase [Candidatus Parcubacteria bacterium]|nr:peptidylprolyl isomerase [Candidatus Parcubacteria bacterium]
MNNKILVLLPVIVLLVLIFSGRFKKDPEEKSTSLNMPQTTSLEPTTLNVTDNSIKYATISTTKGDIKVELFDKDAPKTVTNFKSKAVSNYYQGLTFHRVEDWVIQGGDPLGTGTGGGDMPTELAQTPFEIGSLGIARAGDINVSNDSQFFICTADCSWLTGQYTNFGKVVEGLDIAQKMQVGDKILEIKLEE